MWYRLLSLGVLALSCATRPTGVRCPPGHDLRTGIRRDGRFACWPVPVGDPNWDGVYGRPDRSVQPEGVVEGRIWCTGGALPIVVDARTVACEGPR